MVWTAATKKAEPSGGRRLWVLVQVRGGTAQGARGGIGGGRPLGQGRSGVPRLGVSPSTVGQWDSGTGTVAVACRPARKREIGEVLPPRPLPLFQRQAAGPVSRPPSDRRVHVCTKHQAANAEAARAQAHDNKQNHRTVSVKKPLLPLEFWTSSIGRVCSAGDGVRFGRFVCPSTPVKHPTLIDK